MEKNYEIQFYVVERSFMWLKLRHHFRVLFYIWVLRLPLTKLAVINMNDINGKDYIYRNSSVKNVLL